MQVCHFASVFVCVCARARLSSALYCQPKFPVTKVPNVQIAIGLYFAEGVKRLNTVRSSPGFKVPDITVLFAESLCSGLFS